MLSEHAPRRSLCRLGDEGACALAALIAGGAKFSSLQLAANDINDGGMVALAQVRHVASAWIMLSTLASMHACNGGARRRLAGATRKVAVLAEKSCVLPSSSRSQQPTACVLLTVGNTA